MDDDTGFEHELPAGELAALQRSLAELGEQPLPPAVATRLDARLAAELDSAPLAARRTRRKLRWSAASLSAAAAVAAAVVFALSTGSDRQPVAGGPETAARNSATMAADSAATSVADTATGAPEALKAAAPARRCGPASRKAGDRPRAGCPGARGGHARAV